MRILFLNSARVWGGNEQWTWLCVRELNRLGHAAFLAYRRETVGGRFNVEKIRCPFFNEADLWTLWRLYRFVKRENIQCLVPTKRKDYVLAGWLRMLTGIPCLLRLGIVRDVSKDPFQRFVLSRMCDGIIVNAAAIRDVLCRVGGVPENKVRVIYNGVDTQVVKRLAESASGPVRFFPFQLCGTGMLTARKRFDLLIRATWHLAEELGVKEAGTVIVGDGPERRSLEALADRLGIRARIRFAGHLENPFPLVAASDIFVSASEAEGLSNALLEAMALGKPVVTALAGDAAVAVTDGINGLLWRDRSPKTLAKLLNDLYHSPELRSALGEQAARTVRERYSTERMAKEVAQFCQEVAG